MFEQNMAPMARPARAEEAGVCEGDEWGVLSDGSS